MKRKIELLAPGGDTDSIKAAILAGADAVYCGLDRFNARNRATNISFSDLQGIVRLAHQHNCEVFVTVNIILVENEISSVFTLLNKLANTLIDGIIVQDLGLLHILSSYYKHLKVHASTQLTTHNKGQIDFLSTLKAMRVNLSRELNIHEITSLSDYAHKNNILTEVFVQGSNCISFSGICYMSSVQTGNSGNRGRCSQPCRDKYATTAVNKNYPLNIKDNSAFADLEALYNAGVDSLKIEGRIKKFDYVYTVVDTWKKQIENFLHHNTVNNNKSALYKAFNRDFSNTFLTGEIHKDMFIDNPRDHSIQHLSEQNNYSSAKEKEESELAFYQEKDQVKKNIKRQIDQLSIAPIPLTIAFSGKYGSPLKIRIATPTRSFAINSKEILKNTGNQPLNKNEILKRFKAINDTDYFIQSLNMDKLEGEVYIPFKELTALKNQLFFLLTDSKEIFHPVHYTELAEEQQINQRKPSLSVLISSFNDANTLTNSSATIYFELPSNIKNNYSEYINLFTQNEHLIPWFPSILIGEEYETAINFLTELNPSLIVSNNTGIAHYAYKMGIKWIAGPYINTVNSLSLLCLKEKFNCSGSFISNELSKNQIRNIKRPKDFNLYYSIFHPTVLMTSRQCLFHSTSGCYKNKVDNTCISDCTKTSTITNAKNELQYIEKSRGHYHRIFHHNHFLNTDILKDMPDFFDGYLIDLRDIKTQTNMNMRKSALIALFENLMHKAENTDKKLLSQIHPTSCTSYKKGI